MLKKISHLFRSFFIKIIFGLLMLSFLSWGIGSFSLSLLQSNSIASVGGQDITTSEFQTFSRNIINRLGLNNLSNEDLASNGIYDLSLQSLISQKRFLLEAEDLNIINDENVVKNIIQNDPIFYDESGNFSIGVYRNILASNRISEQDFINDVSINFRSRLVLDAMKSSFKSLPIFSKAIYNFQEQTRDAEIVSIPILNYDIIPSNAELIKHLKENQSELQIPEKRSGKIAKVSLSLFHQLVSVSNSEIKQRYDENLSSITIPKRRDVSILIISDKTKVQEALKDARNKGYLAKSNDSKLEVFDSITQKQLASATFITEVAESAFKSTQQGILDPVVTDFATYIIEVKNFVDEIIPPFSNYKDLISKQLYNEKASNILYDSVGNIEDMISFGENFDTIITSLATVIPTDIKSGTFDDISVKLASVTKFDQLNITNELFSLSIQDEKIKLLEGQNQEYYIISLNSVTLSKKADLKIKEDKQFIINHWQYSKAVEKAKITAKLVKNNFPNNRRIEYYNNLKRIDNDNPSGLAESIRQNLFTLKKNKISVIEDDISVYVVKLTKIRTSKVDKEWQIKLDKLYSDSLLESYKFALENKFSSERNEEKFQTAVNP